MRLAFPVLRFEPKRAETCSAKIFNQTFSSTRALIIIGLSVAFLGLALGLFSIFEESKNTGRLFVILDSVIANLFLIAGLEGGLVGLILGFAARFSVLRSTTLSSRH